VEVQRCQNSSPPVVASRSSRNTKLTQRSAVGPRANGVPSLIVRRQPRAAGAAFPDNVGFCPCPSEVALHPGLERDALALLEAKRQVGVRDAQARSRLVQAECVIAADELRIGRRARAPRRSRRRPAGTVFEASGLEFQGAIVLVLADQVIVTAGEGRSGEREGGEKSGGAGSREEVCW